MNGFNSCSEGIVHGDDPVGMPSHLWDIQSKTVNELHNVGFSYGCDRGCGKSQTILMREIAGKKGGNSEGYALSRMQS